MNDKLGYRIPEAAECLSISVWKIKDEMYQGRIEYIKDWEAGRNTQVGFGREAQARGNEAIADGDGDGQEHAED